MSQPLRSHLDAETLEEVYDDPAAVAVRIAQVREELREAPDEIAELVARGELVALLRCSGALDEALEEAHRADDRAQLAGNLAQQHLARLHLAQVHQARGEYAHSTVLFTELLAVARRFGPVIAAFTYQHAGENEFAQRMWAEARDHFAAAVQIRDEFELEEAEASRIALAAAERHIEEDA